MAKSFSTVCATAISSGIGKNNRRDLVIEAGKSHKFTIPEEELPR
ncbi:hypothetical protein [Salipiger sp.]